jgi:hypothetical protein
MYYKGEYYINGTEVMLSDKYIEQHKYNNKKLWKQAYFHHKIINNGCATYFFCVINLDWSSLKKIGLDIKAKDDYASYFVVEALDLDWAIEEITKPIKLSKEETEARNKAIEYMIEHPKRDWDYPELLGMWLVYIIVLLGSLIFKEFYIIWIVATYIFYKTRKGILDR